MEFRKTVLVDDESVSASAVLTYDLPVNPLSHINFTLKCLNVTDEATLAEILARGTKIEIIHQGTGIHSYSMADLHALNCILFKREPILANRVATDNATRFISLIIPMGRFVFNPGECFPATRKGEFQLQITVSATETACDGLIFDIETYELIGAAPRQYLKVYTKSDTPSATGETSVDLERGNLLAGALIYSTTVPTTTAWTTTVDWLKILRNNVEAYYSKTLWETLHSELLLKCGYLGDHSAAYGDDLLVHYGFLDFDPVGDSNFLMETRDLSSLALRYNAGDTNAMRVLPLEIVRI